MKRNKKAVIWLSAGIAVAVSYIIAKKTQKSLEQERIKVFDNINVNYGDEDN
jgi:hypothetical protein